MTVHEFYLQQNCLRQRVFSFLTGEQQRNFNFDKKLSSGKRSSTELTAHKNLHNLNFRENETSILVLSVSLIRCSLFPSFIF